MSQQDDDHGGEAVRGFALDPGEPCDVHLVRLLLALESVGALYPLFQDLNDREASDQDSAGICAEKRVLFFFAHVGYVCEALTAFAALDENGWFEKNTPEGPADEARALLGRLRELTPLDAKKRLRRADPRLRRLRDKGGAHWDEAAIKCALEKCLSEENPPAIWAGRTDKPETSHSPLVTAILGTIATESEDLPQVAPIVMEMGRLLLKVRDWWLIPCFQRRGVRARYRD